MNRRHRWIRGDWQIANWFLPFVPDFERRLSRNPVSALSRWKIFDNLRRSLVPIVLLVLLVSGWTGLGAPWFWTICVTTIVLFPSLIASGWDLIRKPDDTRLRHHFKNSAKRSTGIFCRLCLHWFVCRMRRSYWTPSLERLAYADNKRKLLEWNPMALIRAVNIKTCFRFMFRCGLCLLFLSVLTYLVLYSPFVLFIALLFCSYGYYHRQLYGG